MGMERTKTTDQYGNVSYELHQDGELVGRILKAASGWYAELPSGSGRSVTSIRKGEELITFWRRLAA